MSKWIFLLLPLFVVLYACEQKDSGKRNFPSNENGQLLLPNGWSLSPAGKQIPLGDFPLQLIISKDNRRGVVTNNGQSSHSLMLLDLPGERILDEKIIPKAWYGLALTQDGKTLYASGGNDNVIRIYDLSADKLAEKDSLVLGKPWPANKISPAGIAVDEVRNLLFAVTKEDSSLYVIDLSRKTIKQRLALGHEAFACILAPDGKDLYISLWGGGAVARYSIAAGNVSATIPVGSHPTEMVFSPDQSLLYVSCADENAVAVVDLQRFAIIENMIAALYPDAAPGSTTNALALSPDGKTLTVANADNNCLAVFDVSEKGASRSKGFIPTGWYPTSVRIANGKILVCNGKGSWGSQANPKGPNPYKPRTGETQYIGSLFKGSLSVINWPDDAALAAYSTQVYANTPYTKAKEKMAEGEKGNPIPRMAGQSSPIKYVFYIIKENRTYDQVLGDMPEGNGDPFLCLFPDSVSPNHHALAREFVLLDNFYVDAEVSADGHNWSTAAYANDFVEKTWPTNYGGRGGNYDYEGTRKIAYPKGGFLWDNCKKYGVSFRSYGEFTDYGRAIHPTLEGHACPRFPSYNLSIKDVFRYEQWKIDFDSLVAKKALPQLSIIRLPNDHTAGARAGVPTPAAMVADNDLALGKLVDHLSKSPVWGESVVFVLEDDAQNGPDHVDAHRSIAFVIGPHVKRNHVESTMYSTSGMLRTIELILGLPPMSQYDAAATPMYACFTKKANLSPYIAKANRIDMARHNPPGTILSKKSYALNLDREDAAPDMVFNEIIWKTVRGEHAVMPAPRRSAFLNVAEAEDD